VRGRPPEPEQSRSKRFVGGEDSALVFRMRTVSSVSRKRVPAMCPPADIMLGEPPLQSPIHAESDDGHVDPRRWVDVAAAEKRHQQVDRH
jgi:hypothetical protein